MNPFSRRGMRKAARRGGMVASPIVGDSCHRHGRWLLEAASASHIGEADDVGLKPTRLVAGWIVVIAIVVTVVSLLLGGG